MKKFSRIFAILLCLLLVLFSFPLLGAAETLPAPDSITSSPKPAASQAPEEPASSYAVAYTGSATKAQGIALMDASNGRLLVDDTADVQIYPASTTKIMTCLLALENGNLDDTITASAEAAGLSDSHSKIHLVEGERMTLRQLLYGLMMQSGNDAAIAIAEYISGSQEEFANLMNQKAQELGMTNTHFVNPHGFHDDNHYSTARDMATLMRVALQNGHFAKIISTLTYTVPPTNKTPDERVWTNSNRMLNPNREEYYEGCTGGKTGYTGPAMGCLVTTAERNGVQLIACIYNDGDPGQLLRWPYAESLLDFGFENYSATTLGEIMTINQLTTTVENAKTSDTFTGSLSLNFTADTSLPVHGWNDELAAVKADNSLITLTPTFHSGSNLTAPITEGDVVGTVSVSIAGIPITTCDLVSTQTVEENPLPPSPTQGGAQGNTGVPKVQSALDAVLLIVIVLCILIILLFIIRTINKRRRRKRRNKIYRRKQAYRRSSSGRRPPNRRRRY